MLRLIGATALAVAGAPVLAQAADETAALRARVEAQDATIAGLKQEVDDLKALVGTRLSTVEARTDGGKVVYPQPSARIESERGDFSLQFVGALQAQAGFFHQTDRGSAAAVVNNGTDFRRLHFGVQGTAFGDFQYALIFDGAATGGVASSIRDATVAYTGWRPWTIVAGNQKPQVGFEPNFSDRSNAQTFLEPALPSNLSTTFGTRQIGVRVARGNDRYSASLGIFGDDLNNNNAVGPLQEGWGGAGRVTFAPVNKPGRLLHVGVSGYVRQLGTAGTQAVQERQLRDRAQPELTIDPARFVDTGNLAFARTARLVGVEGAAVHGPFALQGEFINQYVTQRLGRTDLHFSGEYIEGSFFLTGESRVYEGRTGVFVRTRPKHNFDSGGGWGAFEVAARWSRIDLDSHENELAAGGVRGGVETDYTAALNWYLNPYLRLQFNYIHADAANLTNTGTNEGTRLDIFGLRVHQEF